MIRLNDLVPILDREERLLTDDNWHASASVLRQATEKLRRMGEAMRAAGLDPDAS